MKAHTQSRLWPAACGAAALAASAALLAQDGRRAESAGARSAAAAAAAAADIDRDPQTCISTTSIDRTEVIDDQTVVFFMRGTRVFTNRLSRSCPGLARENRFMYRTQSNRLCSNDTITVLESRGGLQAGFTCGLGPFYPVTREEAERLTRPETLAPEAEFEVIELPEQPDDAAAPAAPAPPSAPSLPADAPAPR